ncbi:TIGR01777 family protein, partial [bacterium]|nr:TIGR01777 family protein [bacterium]
MIALAIGIQLRLSEMKPIAVITGGTGLLGQTLVLSLLLNGYHVRVLTRYPDRSAARISLPVEWIKWDPNQTVAPVASLDGVDCVIHLAGEPVSGFRWSSDRKSHIRQSRIIGTRNLRQAIESAVVPPRVVVSASAIGYYGDTGDLERTEYSPPGDTFLAGVCYDWEQEIGSIRSLTRLVNLRIGVVLDNQGGALAAMLPIFRLGLGAPLGTGNQWLSWIHIDDVVGLIHHA